MFDGTLTTFDFLNPNRLNRFSDTFLLAGLIPGQPVQLTLDSSEFDAFLQVTDLDTGNILFSNDDSTSSTSNAQITFIAQAGVNYLVNATSFGVGETGGYTISNSVGHLIPGTITFIDPNETLTGSLTVDDFTSPNRVGRFRDDFFFDLDTVGVGDQIQIDVSGTFDTVVELVDASSGIILDSNDDVQPGFILDSQLTFTVQPNTQYIFRVSGFDADDIGNYSIATTVVPSGPIGLPSGNVLYDNNPFAFGATPEFASIDGTGNNLTNVTLGSAGTELITIAPTDYADGGSALAGEDRPNPREISNTVGQQDTRIDSSRLLTNFIWAFGQFLDHDLSLTPTQSRQDAAIRGEFINISIPPGDPFLDPTGSGTAEIEVRRSEFVPGTGTGPGNPRQYESEITHWIDLSSVYGSDDTRADTLRYFSGGQLRVSKGNLLPLADTNPNDNPGPTPDDDLFLAGDIRANENVVLSSMHTLFVREHNRIAGELATVHPTWTDEQLYQRARQINIAQWQTIVYDEYLPTLLGSDVLPDYTGYDATIDPRISRTFSTAAYRFGHTQLSSEIERLDTDGNVIPEGNLSLFDSFFPSSDVVRSTGIDPIIRGVASSLSQEVDVKLIDDVRNLLFNFGNFSAAQDLFALNIQRGRDHGLADYNTIRDAFGLPRVSTFADITSDEDTQLALEELYGDVNNIDAFVGMLAEDHLPGGSVGETIAAVLVDQFSSLRNADRFYYANIFSPAEIAIIEDTRLSDIIRRNTDTTIIQDNVFTLFNSGGGGADILNGGLGDDAIYGRNGNDSIFSHAGNDTIRGGNGLDSITAGEGDDRVLGGAGNDTINGGAGNDSLSGGTGNDQINGQDGRDHIRGQSGSDVLTGGNGSDRLYGGRGNDFLQGDRGNDVLTGGSGDDFLVGVAPTDTTPGRNENDELTGGSGSDRFILGQAGRRYYTDVSNNPGADDSFASITDFNRFQDVIQLVGQANQYRLQAVTVTGGPAINTGIYQAGTNDLIGVIEGEQITSLSQGFVFV